MDVGQSASGDTLKKSLDAFKSSLLPHLSEDTEKKAQRIKKILEAEVAKGPLKYTVVGGPNKRDRKKGR